MSKLVDISELRLGELFGINDLERGLGYFRGMADFIPYDRRQQLLLPIDLAEWGARGRSRALHH